MLFLCGRWGLVAVQLLFQLAALLRLQRQGGGRARDQAGNADRLARFLAPAVVVVVDGGNRLLDFFQQLAFAVARAQFQRVLFLDGGTVGGVGDQHGFAQVFRGFAGVFQQFFFQGLQLGLEECHLSGVHVVLFAHRQNFFFGEQWSFCSRGGRFICFGHDFAYLRYDRVFKSSQLAAQAGTWLGPTKTGLVYTKHCSRPRTKMSFGRFLPINTILLPRTSFSAHFAPRSLPINWCTPWNTTLRSAPCIHNTPL